MGIFLDKLRLEEHGTDEWFLLSDYSYKTTAINPELYKTITAPARFINDLASIPRLFQSLIPKVGSTGARLSFMIGSITTKAVWQGWNFPENRQIKSFLMA